MELKNKFVLVGSINTDAEEKELKSIAKVAVVRKHILELKK